MHRFFIAEDFDFSVPERVYALEVGGESEEFRLFDAVDADFYDHVDETGELGEPGAWRRFVERAPIYAIEVDGRAAGWLGDHDPEGPPTLFEMGLMADPEGEAEVYANIGGPPRRARARALRVPAGKATRLRTATDLSPHVVGDAAIRRALPTATIEQVIVLDVGQGSANALLDSANRVVAYVDLGAGVLKNTGTWPADMGGICLCHAPPIVLTHWHYDHFQAANIFPAALGRVWIAPYQTLGPGPQSAMAAGILQAGQLRIWNGIPGASIVVGGIELERCGGANQNRSGIAVWISGPPGADPILLPGDAGYCDSAALRAGRAVSGFAVAHHGGSAPGNAPARPGGAPRAALSYGLPNSYWHPLPRSLAQLTNAAWRIGRPAAGQDERRTADRPATYPRLGHIRLDWPGGAGAAHACGCGCTLDPTQ